MNLKKNIQIFLKKPYKFGFKTNIEKKNFKKGINVNIINLISKFKKEPAFLKEFRLDSYKKWKKKSFPTWMNLNINTIDFTNIYFYSSPKTINKKLLKTFNKLNISLSENDKISNSKLAIDVVFDSTSISTTYKYKLAKYGIIFCSISEAIKNFPILIKKFIGKVVSNNDNFFASLNSAIFSDGSFVFVPKNVKCPLELSTYFRINDKTAGQFERTLIIAEENSFITYLEGCTAPQYDKNQLHAAIVELIAFEKAEIRYSTIQNWYSGNKKGKGGIYNFVTKRGICLGKLSKISWTQIETGSALTWKYPSCYLVGSFSKGEFYSIALTKNCQETDTGTKMIHLAENTKSKIISKGISANYSKNTYRGLVKFIYKSKLSQNFSQCDSFLIGNKAVSFTYPYIEIKNSNIKLEYEAKVSKFTEEQIFYLLQRGFSTEKAIELLISGFCKDILYMLPQEFSLEVDKLLSLKLDNGIG